MILGKTFDAELQFYFNPTGEYLQTLNAEKTASRIQLENTFKVISDATRGSIGRQRKQAVASILFYSVSDCVKVKDKETEYKECQAKLKKKTAGTYDFFNSLQLRKLKGADGRVKGVNSLVKFEPLMKALN